MSFHDDGYHKGYEDAMDGKGPPPSGLLWSLISAVLDLEGQKEWDEGYRDGYTAGKAGIEDE